MRFFKFLTLLLVTVSIISCGKDDDGGTSGGGSSDTFWYCKVDGEDFRIEGDYAFATYFDIDNTIAVYGSEDQAVPGFATIFIALKNDDGMVGTYDLSLNGDATGTYNDTDPSETFLSAFEDGGGTMEITKIDDEFVEGTFSFTAFDGNGNSKEITDGSFKVRFN